MSTFSFNKSGNDAKSNTLGSMNRQNVIQETNKKRTLLKDSSWIKSRPEEEEEKIKDENFGKTVLNRYKSQEDLDSAFDKEEKKPIHNRFRSDDALDRIPSRNTYEGGNKAATLERVPMSGPEATNKSRQSWAPSNKTTTTTITEESKRKSWTPTNRNNTTTTTTTTTETKQAVPGKPEGQKITIYSSDSRTADKQPRAAFVDSARSRFEKTEEKPSPPTSPRIQYAEEKPNLPPRSPIAKTDERPSYPSKPVISETGERRSPMERKQRSQDIDNLIEISTTKVASNKSSAQDVDDLIDIKPATDKAKRREQLDDFIEISNTARNYRKKDDSLDNLIEIKKPDVKTRTGNLDNLIDIKTTTTVKKGSQDLDDLISIGGDINKGTTKPASTNITNRSSTTTTTYNVKEETNDLPNRRSTTTTTYNVKEADDAPKRRSTTTTTYNAKEESNDVPNPRSSTTTTYNIMEGTSDVPSRRSTTTSRVTDYQDVPSRRSNTSSSYKVTDDTYDVPSRRTTTSYKDTTDGPNSRSNVTVTHETSYSSLPNSSYGDLSRTSSSNTYGSNIVSNSIKTVYSTSDRTVMEKDMCTYCRKPLGIDAKMILKDMNICCHATCFKCEACSGTLENLKAGDSMWIYKQTIHCEPCYFTAREKWII